MTAVDPRALRVPGTAPVRVPGGTRLERRAALDLSIDDELLRGELRGAALTGPLRNDLAILVEHELTQSEPLSETRFLAAGLRSGLFAAGRRRRHLEALIEMHLVRREGEMIHATVAGIAAVRRLSAADETAQPPRELLRALRRAEISSIVP